MLVSAKCTQCIQQLLLNDFQVGIRYLFIYLQGKSEHTILWHFHHHRYPMCVYLRAQLAIVVSVATQAANATWNNKFSVFECVFVS